MSTGENINANGSTVTEEILKAGFRRFPQTVQAQVAENLWPAFLTTQIAPGYPFHFVLSAITPPNEIWFVDGNGTQLGRIIHLAAPPPPPGPISTLQLLTYSLSQKGSNYTVNATYTDTPNLQTTWTVWTSTLKNSKSTIEGTGSQMNTAGSYTVVCNFKGNPKIPIYLTVVDAAYGEAEVQLA